MGLTQAQCAITSGAESAIIVGPGQVQYELASGTHPDQDMGTESMHACRERQ